MSIIGPVIDSQYLVSNVDRFKDRDVASITAEERSEVASEQRKVSEVDVDNALDELKQEWGTDLNTPVKFYNASGESLKVLTALNWYGGFVGNSLFEQSVANGQWIVYLHAHPTDQEKIGSAGCIVLATSDTGVVLAYLTGPGGLIKAYTEIRDKAHYFEEEIGYWIFKLVQKSEDTTREKRQGYESEITNESPYSCSAIIQPA